MIKFDIGIKKTDGAPRIHFKSFKIPVPIPEEYSIIDGMCCEVTISINNYVITEHLKVGSGTELYIPSHIARSLRTQAEKTPNGSITFEIHKLFN